MRGKVGQNWDELERSVAGVGVSEKVVPRVWRRLSGDRGARGLVGPGVPCKMASVLESARSRAVVHARRGPVIEVRS
jgi:hypothetical protein